VADFSPYGIPDNVLSYVQGNPMPQQVTATEYPIPQMGQTVGSMPSPPPPPPPPPQSIGPGMPSVDETPNYGIHPNILNALGVTPPSPSAGAQFAATPPQAQSVTGGALPTQDLAAQPMQAPAPSDVPLGTVDTQKLAKQQDAIAKQQAAQAAYAQTPDGLYQQSDAQTLAALNKEREGVADAASAEQAENTAKVNAMQASQDRIAKQDAENAAKNAQQDANRQKIEQQWMQAVNDSNNYKVNTDRSIGVGGLISIALSGIGDALDHQHGPNAALQIIENGIDKNIADQWAQKKALGDKASGIKNALDYYTSKTSNDREAQQLQRASMLADAKSQLDLAAAKSANPIVAARAKTLSVAVDQKIAGVAATEAQRKAQEIRDQQDQAFKNAQLGVSYGELGLRKQEHADQVAQNDRDFALKVAQLEAAGDKEAADQLRAQKAQADGAFQRSVGVDKSGTERFVPVVNQDGQPYGGTGNKDVDTKLIERDEGYVGLIHAYDAARQLRHENGGSFGSSEEGRKTAQAVARAQIQFMRANGYQRVSDVTLDQAEKVMAGDKDVTNSFIKSVLPNLDDARHDAQLDRLNMHRSLGKFTGDARQFEIADPLTQPRTPSLGDQLSQPTPNAAPPEPPIAPQTNAPSVINNFGQPVASTLPVPQMSPHEYVMSQIHGSIAKKVKK